MKVLERETMRASKDTCAHEVLEVVPLVMRTIRAEMRDHRAPDLSIPQFRTLSFLNRHEGASLSDVAEHIGLRLPSMSKLVDGLVERNLVKRETHPDDRRRMTLVLTARGRTMLQTALEGTRACLAERLASLPASERAIVAQAMRILHPLFASGLEAEVETSR
jgi:DNA-binding MarR family transcriptional regulator